MERNYLRYAVISDLHYLSPSLHDGGKAFQSLLPRSSGILLEHGEEIMDEAVREILKEKPDGVLIPGDLTWLGERESLRDVFRKLSVLKDAGVRIFVIPGNHDIEHPKAASYFGERIEKAEGISPLVFREEAGPFGYDDALSYDRHTNSYVTELCTGIRLLALDANMPQSREVIPDTTLAWAEKELDAAYKQGIRVICMTHQNLLRQHDFMDRQVRNHAAVEALLRRYRVSLSLSGHCHLQNISGSDGLTDISTGCLMIWPLNYGILRISPGSGHDGYEVRKLGILQEEAKQRLDDTVTGMILPALADKNIPRESLDGMMDYARDLCADIFAGYHGVRADLSKYPAAAEDWKKYAGDTFWYRFLFPEEKTA